MKGKVVRKPPEKARRRIPLPILQEGVDEADWDWEIPQNHSTPKGEDVRKEVTEVTENGCGAKNTIHTPAGSKIGRTEEAEKQGSPKPPPGPKPGGGTGHPSHLEQQEEQYEAEEPGHQAQATEQTDAGAEKVLNWADGPWTNMPAAKDGEEATKEKAKEKEREPIPREVGGIRGEAGRVWAEKANNREDSKKICRKKSVTGVEGSATPSTSATTQDTHWGMGSGGERGTAITAANSTQW